MHVGPHQFETRLDPSTDTTFSSQQAPASEEERNRLFEKIASLDVDRPLTRKNLEELARSIVDRESDLAWTMVLIGSRRWRKAVLHIPFERRILLLPHCMRHSELCPADYDAQGLQCRRCGLCPLGKLKSDAESLGYHVLIAEGSPIVMQWILNGKADAILGVGCLRSLERAFDQLLLAGIPAMAVPLNEANCRDSTSDQHRIDEMIRTPFEPQTNDDPVEKAPNWIHLLRGAAGLFDPLPDTASMEPLDPIGKTERLGREFLRRGGKFYRPFITLATFDALTGSVGAGPEGAEHVKRLPDWVQDVARAVEIFHKASLVHDDIEDGDPFRYGKPALHRSEGTAMAINVGDYLVGLGYRTIARLRDRIPEAGTLSPGELVAEMLTRLSEAHLRLSEGQGAELAWQSLDKNRLSSLDALKIYVLKTAPAFEAALGMGILSAVAAGGVDHDFYVSTREPIARFSRHLGVAFQIKNDLDDWHPDQGNKRRAGADALSDRPTLMRSFVGSELKDSQSLEQIRDRFRRSGAFDKAWRLVEKYAHRARETAMEIDHPALRRLLLHFVETIATA